MIKVTSLREYICTAMPTFTINFPTLLQREAVLDAVQLAGISDSALYKSSSEAGSNGQIVPSSDHLSLECSYSQAIQNHMTPKLIS